MVRREVPWQRFLALHDLEEGRLLAEEVVVGTTHDAHADAIGEAGLVELADGPFDGGDGAVVYAALVATTTWRADRVRAAISAPSRTR